MRLGRPSLAVAEGGDPANGVAGEKQQAHASVAHPLDAAELPDVPVFVVADAEECLAAQAAVGREHVAVRAIRHVVAVLLEPVSQRKLERQEFARAEGERVIDDAVMLRLAAVGPVEADVGPGPLPSPRMGVEREVVRPAVVGLPGIVGALEQDVGRAIVADDEDDVALPVRLGVPFDDRREPPEIDAAEPVGGNRQTDGRLPPALVQVLGAGRGDRLGLALERAERRHEPRAPRPP